MSNTRPCNKCGKEMSAKPGSRCKPCKNAANKIADAKRKARRAGTLKEEMPPRYIPNNLMTRAWV